MRKWLKILNIATTFTVAANTITACKKKEKNNNVHLKQEYKEDKNTAKIQEYTNNKKTNNTQKITPKLNEEEINNLSNTNSLLELQKKKRIATAGDGSCLFWAVATAYLLPARDNHIVFKERFEKLFGKEKIDDLDFIKFLLKINNFNIYNTTYYEHKIACDLIQNVFRNKVIDYSEQFVNTATDKDIQAKVYSIEDDLKGTERFEKKLKEFKIDYDKNNSQRKNNINFIKKYLNWMREKNTWAGTFECESIVEILNVNIEIIHTTSYNEEAKEFFKPRKKNKNTSKITILYTGSHFEFRLEKTYPFNI